MKLKYIITEIATEDLAEIWIYTYKKWSIDQADKYYNLIIAEIEFISENFNTGKPMDYIKKGYRASKVKSHIIFYRKSNGNLIEIIRILHERMDIENRLRE